MMKEILTFTCGCVIVTSSIFVTEFMGGRGKLTWVICCRVARSLIVVNNFLSFISQLTYSTATCHCSLNAGKRLQANEAPVDASETTIQVQSPRENSGPIHDTDKEFDVAFNITEDDNAEIEGNENETDAFDNVPSLRKRELSLAVSSNTRSMSKFPYGTCGHGSIGNGVCKNGACCSIFGWCAHGKAWCSRGTCGNGRRGTRVCPDNGVSGNCCTESGTCARCDDPIADAFTIIFISDMETSYRNHHVEWCERIVGYVKDISKKDLTFDGKYAAVKITPQLVIHGGDISDYTYGTWDKKGSDAASYLMDNVWGQLYDAGIPMISSLGNHDFNAKNPVASYNAEANDFVRDTFARSKRLKGSDFSFSEVQGVGPSLFVAEFGGVQIVNFNYHAFLLDPNQKQFNELANQLDRSKKTIFFSHYPLSSYPSNKQTYIINLISQFAPGTAHFSGHRHQKRKEEKTKFNDYIAAYPHPWEDSQKSGEYFKAGMYAALISPDNGVLQVKNIELPYQDITGCWSDGTVCLQGTTCNQCCNTARQALMTQCGGAEWDDGTQCGLGTTCRACRNKATYWYGKAFTACGEEPCWGDGTRCLAGTSCNSCCNGYEWWDGPFGHHCGREPAWEDGTVCAVGTTCNNCKNKATYWYGKAFTACGQEPCWGDGTRCLAGTSCNSCCNSYEWWDGPFGHHCGREPCWGRGTVCGAGTTCNSCCSGASCPWYQFGVCNCK